MYHTTRLSFCKSDPDPYLQSRPPAGPNSGYLVYQDKEPTPTSCFGLGENQNIKDLPIPQNKLLSLIDHSNTNEGACRDVYLIPVINHPLSSNRYYVIKADGKHRGEAYVNSKNGDVEICCFFKYQSTGEVKPIRPLDPMDIYQQFRITISCQPNKLIAESVAPDGHPPHFLRNTEWKISVRTPKSFNLGIANGLHDYLRAYHPDFNFPLSQKSSRPMVVGKWYCPLMFIKEEEEDQIHESVFYQMTLEQRWERIFFTQISNTQDIKDVKIDVLVPTMMVRIRGNEAVRVKKKDGRRLVWFRSKEAEVGLSTLILNRMMWLEERGGWVKRKEKKVRVVKEDEYGRLMWTKYGCYALVESFVLRRSDNTVVLTYDFVHDHQLKSKWE